MSMTDSSGFNLSLDHVDSSRLKDFMGCPRYDFFRHVCGWRLAGPQIHLDFGTAIHAGLAELYRHNQPWTKPIIQKMVVVFMTKYMELFPSPVYVLPGEEDGGYVDPNSGPKCLTSGVRLLEGYANTYQDDRLTPLQVETGGLVMIDSSRALAFRIDLIAELPDGSVHVIEHKTSGSTAGFSSGVPWTLDIQVGTYLHVLFMYFAKQGKELTQQGLTINGLVCRVKEPGYVRVPIVKNEVAQLTWLDIVRRTYDELEENIRALKEDHVLKFPMRTTNCTRWGTCKYAEFCMAWGEDCLNRIVDLGGAVPAKFQRDFWNPLDNVRNEINLEGA